MVPSIPIWYSSFLNRSIWSIDGTITLGQSRPESNSNEEVTTHFPELYIYVCVCVKEDILYSEKENITNKRIKVSKIV